MLSEEEKKAIELLKLSIDKNSALYISDLGDNTIRIILNLIEKQQKEIEEYKETINVLKPNLEELIEMCNFAMQKDYISKDKIKELLEEYRSTGYYELERVLEQLLEE